jgi:hypothetical protein
MIIFRDKYTELWILLVLGFRLLGCIAQVEFIVDTVHDLRSEMRRAPLLGREISSLI